MKNKPASRKRTLVWLWSILGAVIIVAAAWRVPTLLPARHAGGPSNPGGPPSVVLGTVRRGNIDIALDALGVVTSLSTVTVMTQISGQLVNVAFREGQDVKKGDLLAEIDARPYQLALELAQGQLTHDQALLTDAQLDLGRYQTLAATNAIPKQQYDDQVALVQQYQGSVVSDQATIDTAKLNIAYCHIVAPAGGRIGLRQVDQGNYVTPISTNTANGIVVITQIKPISVIFTVPEDSLPAILHRLHQGATLPATAFDRSGTTELGTGTLATLDNQIDTTTGTLKLRAQFPNDDGDLFPNQFVNIRLVVDTLDNATLIPTSAVQSGAPGTFVYLYNRDGTVSVRKVVLGPVDGEQQAIRSGLMPGDQVVVGGADKLRDGAKVVLRNPGSAATPTSGAGGTDPQRGRPHSGRPGASQAGPPTTPSASEPGNQPTAPPGAPGGQ